jgi:hypothetical protein
MADDLGAFARKLDNIMDSFVGRVNDETLREIGNAAVRDAAGALAADIGDQSMSRWPVGKPFELTAEAKLEAGGVSVTPVRNARGPWRVLESGRAGYAAGDRRNSGTRTRKSDGVVVQKTRKVKRATGAAGGRGTWSAAVETMQRETPGRVDEAFQRVLRRQFGG